ncbi:hsp20/alpha crystallin family [Gigaspora margarita]|uniref:Hsp20/alpha crystallin family n=1 Tax=Gigaspora margarita TaxID=4874 RepID=A0A8H3X2Q8_GIGMA|nr:hsp20/alpha crystallin family [Gigaspora margarita]
MTTLQSIGVDKTQTHDFESLEKLKAIASRELEFVSYKDAHTQWGIYKNKDELCPSDAETLLGDNEKQLCMELVDHDDNLEFVIDEHASYCSNGIIVTENDQELDVKIDLEDFNIHFQVCHNTLAIFGSKEDLGSSSETTTHDSSTVGVRSYQSFCHPIKLPTSVNVNKIFSTFIDEKMHIKVPKKTESDIIEEALEAGYCAICKWKECLNKYFPGLSSTDE